MGLHKSKLWHCTVFAIIQLASEDYHSGAEVFRDSTLDWKVIQLASAFLDQPYGHVLGNGSERERIKSCSHSLLLGAIIALRNRHMFKRTGIVALDIVKSVNHRLELTVS
jgi:hypothetical protein